MKKIVSLTSAVVAVLTLGSHANAAQQPYEKKAYDATYDIVQPVGGNVTNHTLSDGKGHMRMETVSSGMKTIMVQDWLKLQLLTLLDAQKMAMKSKIPANSYQGTDAEDLKTKLKAKDLGSKVVAGHPSHGYGYTNAVGSTEVWIGNDIGVLTQSTSSLPGGKKSIQTLKSYTAGAPAASNFAMDVPAGYKVTGSW